MKNNINNYDLIIIGAGPAGLTSAIYACRAQLKVLIIDQGPPGGKMIKTYDIENYPGFEAVLGPDLSISMYQQAEKLGVIFENSKVLNIETVANQKIVICDNQKTFQSQAIIVATGTLENELKAPGAREFYGKGVSYCAVCDGAFFKGEPIVVVGGGDSAVEEAVYLTKFAKKIYLVHRRETFRASKQAMQIAQNNDKISWFLNYVVKAINGDANSITKVILEHTITKETTEIIAKAVFPYIGATPISSFVKDLVNCDASGYIVTNANMQTSVDGIFAVGDVRQTPLRQIATAVGDGAIAAQEAIRYIDHLKQTTM